MTCLTVKSINVRDADVGSLVRFDRDGAAQFAIIVTKGEYTSRMIRIRIDTNEFQHTEVNNDIDGLNLGTDWFFEATDIAAWFVEGDEASKRTGILAFSEEGDPLLSVFDILHLNDIVYWNLKKAKNVLDRSRVPAATDNWALWANKEERESPRGKPLYIASSSQKP